jgi:HSP20 family molecular chaperone IbpA
MRSPRTRSTHAAKSAAWDGTQIMGEMHHDGHRALFNPFRELGRFEPFGREMEDLFKGFFVAPVPFNQISAGRIPIDVTEDDKSYRVRAELSGFSREEIDVSVNGDQVSISADSKKEKQENRVTRSSCANAFSADSTALLRYRRRSTRPQPRQSMQTGYLSSACRRRQPLQTGKLRSPEFCCRIGPGGGPLDRDRAGICLRVRRAGRCTYWTSLLAALGHKHAPACQSAL